MQDKWVESHQMWWSLFAALIASNIIGMSYLSFAWVFLGFWLIWPSLLILCAIYNWIVK